MPFDPMHCYIEGIGKKMLNLLFLDLIETKRCTVDELNTVIQDFDYGKPFIADKMKILTLEEIRTLSVSCKAAQILTFYKLAPFILKSIIIPDSENYKPFRILREIIMGIFSISMEKSFVDSLNGKIKSFLTEWKTHYEPLHGFQPNFHFMQHLVDDIKNFGHPFEFSCFRYESKHQSFKIISRKKHGFKYHLKTVIETYVGSVNLKIKNQTFMKSEKVYTFKKSHNAVILYESQLVRVIKCEDNLFSGNILEKVAFNNFLNAVEVKETELITGVIGDEGVITTSLLEFDEKKYVLNFSF